MSKTGNQREVQVSPPPSSGAGRPPPRREYARELKLQVVKESFTPGSSASIAARRHNINSEYFEHHVNYVESLFDPFFRKGHVQEFLPPIPCCRPQHTVCG